MRTIAGGVGIRLPWRSSGLLFRGHGDVVLQGLWIAKIDAVPAMRCAFTRTGARSSESRRCGIEPLSESGQGAQRRRLNPALKPSDVRLRHAELCSLCTKSWTFTRSGLPAGIHSAPPVAKFPTSSRLFASTEITGSPPAWNALTCALMYRNWASRSGCCLTSTVLALPCKLYPACLSTRPTVTELTPCPALVNSSARCTVDFVVHRNADSGSPRVSGSTNSSTAATRSGTLSSAAGRPAPGARTRPSGTTPDSNSCAPRDTVSALAFAAVATTFIPPYPIARASAPSSSRNARSSSKRPDLRESGRHPHASVMTVAPGSTSPRGVLGQAVAAGDPPRLGRRGAPTGLPQRVRVPLQPARIPEQGAGRQPAAEGGATRAAWDRRAPAEHGPPRAARPWRAS